MNIETLVIPTQDGYQLAATEFRPKTGNGIGIIINGATGVLRKYYQAFAEHLCDSGFTVLTYDFRGIGDSKNKADHAPEPSMLHWGQRDMDAVFNLFSTRHPELTIKGIGHSIGGQLLGVMPNNNRYVSFLNIASQHIYWKNWNWKDRPIATLFFFVILPFFYTFAGGLPKWVLGAEYLPKQVAKDWSRFGRKKAWIADEKGRPLREGFLGFTGRMKLIGMADDNRFAPPWAVKKLAQTYKNADKELRIIDPKEYDMKSIDHFGFFQRKMNKHAWNECVQWLAQN
jgi:predicted alpha/beta hydrolase